ncbi:glycosyl hydrolase family 18 protein [Massilia sp. P8910]|uniref:glycosyl hydrolase family 18 protein n=1 Tax=Massilia antarctica TaxID=2765360 RepID=UPI001E401238|nr:glycosyl hydrolase family 18 protein [Massilia antarctica]MCE3607819.1 glycosyl hydrolase family 18 protein [Massilia antarctica]
MKNILKYLGMAAIGGAILSGCGGGSSGTAPNGANAAPPSAARPDAARPDVARPDAARPGTTMTPDPATGASPGQAEGVGTAAGTSAAVGPCNAVTWSAGINYPLGTVVLYLPNGLYYKVVQVAGNGSDGTTPTISTWYWAQTTCGIASSKKISAGYYPNWTPSPVRIRDVNARYNLIYLFAATPVGGPPGSTGAVTWSAPGNGRGAATNLKADIQYARSTQGRKIILSVGGAGNGMSFPNRTKSQTFVNSIAAVHAQLGGIDGMDWNTFEGSQTPDTGEMIWISLELKKRFPGFIISAPPAPWNPVDKEFCRAMVAAGALDYAAPQYYDGPDLANPAYVVENIKQWVSLLGASHVVVGFGIDHATNYMTRDQAIATWKQVKANHPDIRGGFDWSIHTDEAQGWPFANGVAPLINP